MAQFTPTASDDPADPVSQPTGRRRKDAATSAELALRAVTLIAQRGTLTVSELARELDVASSTAHRVLTNCRRAGFARQESPGAPYVIGPAMHEIALTVTGPRNLREAAGPVLSQLQNHVDEMVSFYVLEGKYVRVVQTYPGSRTKTVAPSLGKLLPAHCTAGGKALLSRETPEQLRRRFPGGLLAQYTERSITDWSTLMDDLTVTRQRGWSVSVGEFDPRLTSIAAPVVLSTGAAVGAVVLTGYASWLRTRAEIEAIAPRVMEAATAVTARMRN
ncbi:IclR family transcriptional regulator [Rhodococcus jostii]|uniref:DNA-binding transcriptional regulator, IclR family n=1 Tax=Rhodococcus jostii TaxID=132919 RepID=A0A1H5DPY3_RHOJO|nr:IclR family transcriptional regulator [Rhodococcus jostii]SED80969.1 DNA-binding transcriptional regulator, IclR family [Rhodococcus jostii]